MSIKVLMTEFGKCVHLPGTGQITIATCGVWGKYQLAMSTRDLDVHPRCQRCFRGTKWEGGAILSKTKEPPVPQLVREDVRARLLSLVDELI